MRPIDADGLPKEAERDKDFRLVTPECRVSRQPMWTREVMRQDEFDKYVDKAIHCDTAACSAPAARMSMGTAGLGELERQAIAQGSAG